MSRLVRIALAAAALSSLAATFVLAAPAPEKVEPKAPPRFDLVGFDDSALQIELLDETLELDTKYGTLKIPAADVVRVEFAARVPAAVETEVGDLIAKLGHADFKVREAATASLKRFRERAYPAAVKATRADDPEVGRRAAEVTEHVLATVRRERIAGRPFDVVYTADAKLVGSLRADVLRVRTKLFGEQRVQAHDLLSMRAPGHSDASAAVPAPVNLAAYANQFGKELTLQVTAPAVPAGSAVWGSDQYSLDSSVANAAVHAGVVQPGLTATVKVRIVASPPAFTGTFRHGVSTTNYGAYAGGAFEFVK